VAQTVAALASTACFVVHEVYCRIEHCLLFNGDAKDITDVRSKAEALGQCAGWLDAHVPNARRVPCESSAKATQDAATGNGIAAIGTETAGALYGVRTLERGIEDNHENTTRASVTRSPLPHSAPEAPRLGPCVELEARSLTCSWLLRAGFVLLARTASGPSLMAVTGGVRSPFRTLLRFSPQDGAESLPAALAALARRAIPVLSVVPVPTGAPWLKTYVVEVSGHREDAAVGAALDELGRLCSSTRWLGSYTSA
jgi:prephenate dehydratase